MDMRFGLWNVRSLYRVGSLLTVSRELSKCKLDLVEVQEVRFEGRGTEPAGEYTFFYGNGNEGHELGTCFFVHEGIISAIKRIEFVSDRMSYMIVRGRLCHIIVLNVHAPTEDNTDDVKDSFYEELERVFDNFPKYHMKILLGDFNAKVSYWTITLIAILSCVILRLSYYCNIYHIYIARKTAEPVTLAIYQTMDEGGCKFLCILHW
jgi:hypothetical protein